MASFWTWSPANQTSCRKDQPARRWVLSSGYCGWPGASDLAAALAEGATRSWVSDCKEERQRKKNKGDFAELMCDRKSSRRHAGKRESSSRTSESGSRSADGAAPEIPIVIPDGKEFRTLLGLFVEELQVDEATAASSLLLSGIFLHTKRQAFTCTAQLSSFSQEMFPPCWLLRFSC